MNQINEYLYSEIVIKKGTSVFDHKLPQFKSLRSYLFWGIDNIISQLNIIFNNI